MNHTDKEPIKVDEFEPFDETKESVINDLNLENIKFSTISGPDTAKEPLLEKQDQQIIDKFSNLRNYNNNHHVVPIGVLIVLTTIYLGMNNVQKCLVNCSENPQSINLIENIENNINYMQTPENLKHTQILERLLEYKDICKDLEIFTKDLNLQQLQQEYKNTREDDELIEPIEDNSSGSGLGNINGNCAKETFIKLRKSKYSIKTTNAKNGFNKYNKSVKAKFLKNHKKELNLNKKNSTAEPIIYLFALVFIYLLLKAANDINQHYKSQNKNDKRLRRCSLQSYAQIHRPDRRASKELALKQKQQQQQQRLRSLSRTITHDHLQYMIDAPSQKPDQLPIIKQHVGQSSSSPVRTQITTPANNWQLLRQHTTHSLDNSDITTGSRLTKELPSMMTRRCSVPVALNYQRQKISTISPLTTFNDGSLNRRTSIASSSLHLPLDPIESLIPETKRRVRMINRH